MLSFRSPWIGESPAVCQLLKTVEKVAQTESALLLVGESGTGKELVARAVHERSMRAAKPFWVVHCGALPADLLETELFGHANSAVTGVLQNQQSSFGWTNGCTLFLDEVSELPLHLQVKLLHILQTREFNSVGSSQPMRVNVRMIAATHCDLGEAVLKKEFLEDLYDKLNVISIQVPSLRERKTDIPLLVNHFIQQINQATGHSVEPPTGQILEALLAYDWPGNVRELENLMERLVILKGTGSMGLADLPHRIFQQYTQTCPQGTGALSAWEFPKMLLPEAGVDLKSIVAAFENHLVDQALARTSGNKNRASGLLSMNRTTLVEKLRKRGMITPLSVREASVE